MELILNLVAQLAPDEKVLMRKHLKISADQLIMSIMFLLLLSSSQAFGNVHLHEWTTASEASTSIVNEKGEAQLSNPENLTTWIFEDGTFIPMAKLQGDKSFSIITDHLGTPVESYDEEGKKVWSRELNIYGETRREFGVTNFIPFLYQGQYLDNETELAYNRFRYYDSSSGVYISQDPIRLLGQMPNMYSYVPDVNCWVDFFGLDLKPENGYTRGKRHGLKLSDKDAQIIANDEALSHGRWGNKADLAEAGKLADKLEPGGFHDFPVNSDSKSVVFHPGVDANNPVKNSATHYRLRNNGNGTFHGFPIDGTAEPIKGEPAKFKPKGC